jgi:hypothetical protein
MHTNLKLCQHCNVDRGRSNSRWGLERFRDHCSPSYITFCDRDMRFAARFLIMNVWLTRIQTNAFHIALTCVLTDIFFCDEGLPHHSLKADDRWMSSFFLPSFTSNGAPVEWKRQGKTDNSENNLSQCHFVHHKSHMDLTWDRTRASVVRGRRLAAWAMARPLRDIL